MLRPIPLVYFDKGKAPRIVDPVAFWPSGKWKRAGGPDPVPAKPAKPRPGILVAMDLGFEPSRTVAFLWGGDEAVHVLDAGRNGVRLDGKPVRRKKRRRGRLRKGIHAAGNAPPARERPWWEAEDRESCPYFNPPGRGVSVVAENNAMVLVLRATTALRDYLRLHDRGGHLAPWLRDGKRFRVVDARDQAYARGDTSTREVAGALLALTREQLEAVRRAADVPADIGRIKPEGEW